ncbi:MAG: hypothetical protein LLF76_02235 [Planctomycetaceae bacterium]|nr:hypothetical protein [Planctomycetaceae bacterium]
MRLAKFITCEYRRCSRDGVVGDWTALSNAMVTNITLRPGRESNTATIELSDTRWNVSRGVIWGYQIRLRYNSTVLFQGFIVNFNSGYSSSEATDPEDQPKAREWTRMYCMDYRWLYNRCSPIYGQVARGADDYNADLTKKAQATFMSGRRCVFNPDGCYNMDPDSVEFTSSNFTTHVFGDSIKKTNTGSPWTAGTAINLLLSPIYNGVPSIVSIIDPLDLPGLSHADFDIVLNDIICDGLGVTDGVALICDNIGWTFREEYSMAGPLWVFYKNGIAAGSSRVYMQGSYNPCLLHTLHAPAFAEIITAAVAEGRKMVMATDLTEDIDPVVNQPLGLAAPHRFEITAELVPAWKDSELHIPATGTSGLFYTESALASQTNPNSLGFFKYHHAQGDSFLQDAGRKWALNESGKYTGGDYDRGNVFDFTTVGIPDSLIKDGAGKKLYGPFRRFFKPCLTLDKDSMNSVGTRVQWSRDGGATWQELTCPYELHKDEAAIRLTIPNLSEIVDISKANIAAGDYTGQEINYFTSLADDKHNGRHSKFIAGQETTRWKTRVRITATVQMDQRLGYRNSTVYDGSPFVQARIYDYADRYLLQQRCSSSSFYSGSLAAWDVDDTSKLNAQMELIRQANEDMAKHGRFELDRLWIDGTNPPNFLLGDGIYGLTGRDYPLAQTLGARTVSPEIVEIQYQVQSQKQILLIRDPRLSIVVHDRQSRQRHR